MRVLFCGIIKSMAYQNKEDFATLSDEEIIEQYKNGNKEIFNILTDRYISSMYNFIYRFSNRNDIEDIIQEIFIKVWKNINGFDSSKASFKTWLFTIAKNTATDFSRKKKHILFSDIGDDENDDGKITPFEATIPAEEPLPDILLERMENSQLLNKVLEKIRPEYRIVLVLHYQEEMTFEEIGRVLEKPLNTVKSQHRRALAELRNMLNQAHQN